MPEETPGESRHRLREVANKVPRGVTMDLVNDPLSKDLNSKEELHPRDHRHQEVLMAPRG